MLLEEARMLHHRGSSIKQGAMQLQYLDANNEQKRADVGSSMMVLSGPS